MAFWDGAGQPDAANLYTRDGGRKYLNRTERQRVLAATKSLRTDQALFAMTLAWTGARVSEVLSLTAASFQMEAGIVALWTLKRRRPSLREVPVPPELIAAIDAHFRMTERQRHAAVAAERLWPWSRVTAWRLIKSVMLAADITGRHATPRGLRHAFGVDTLQSGVPLNLIQRWMGHSRMSSTAVYAAVAGPEELHFARRFWAGRLGGTP